MIHPSDPQPTVTLTFNNPEKTYPTEDQLKSILTNALVNNKNQQSEDQSNYLSIQQSEQAEWPDLEQDYNEKQSQTSQQNKTFTKVKAEIAELLGWNPDSSLPQQQINTQQQIERLQKFTKVKAEVAQLLGWKNDATLPQQQTNTIQQTQYIPKVQIEPFQHLEDPQQIDQQQNQLTQQSQSKKLYKVGSQWKYIPTLKNTLRNGISKFTKINSTQKKQAQASSTLTTNLGQSYDEQNVYSPGRPHQNNSDLKGIEVEVPAGNCDNSIEQSQQLLLTTEDNQNTDNGQKVQKKVLLMQDQSVKQCLKEAILELAAEQFQDLLLSKQTKRDRQQSLLHLNKPSNFRQYCLQKSQHLSLEQQSLKQSMKQVILEVAERQFQDMLLSRDMGKVDYSPSLCYSKSKMFQEQELRNESTYQLKSQLLTVKDSFSYHRPQSFRDSQVYSYPTTKIQPNQQNLTINQTTETRIINAEKQQKLEANKIQVLQKIRNLIKMSAQKHARLQQSKSSLNDRAVQSSIQKIVVEAENIIDQLTQEIKQTSHHSQTLQKAKYYRQNQPQKIHWEKAVDPLSRIADAPKKITKIQPTDKIAPEQVEQQKRRQKDNLIQHLQAVLDIREQNLKQLNLVNEQQKQNQFKKPRPSKSQIQLPLNLNARPGPPVRQQIVFRSSESCKCNVM